ncbi:MAG TPA: NAD-dependent deacylase [Thioalkalivibrio sp.]|nr:NAD-dependent deacylase [Thioalkalivibrio sp.]
MTEVERAAAIVAEQAAHGMPIVALTGAGISAESGVPTFRGRGGIWTQHDPERVATLRGFREDPARAWTFHEQLRRLCRGAAPNLGHLALAWIDVALGDSIPTPVITQNIDGLHQAAGSRDVLELHGSALRVRCAACDYRSDDLPDEFEELPPHCHCGALLRPDVVWFGETLPEAAMRQARRWAEAAGAMLVIGTSATVQPAASLPVVALRAGAAVIEVNPEPTALTAMAAVALRGPAGAILPALVSALGDRLSGQTLDARME